MTWLSVIKSYLFKKKKAKVPKQPIIQEEDVPKQVQKIGTDFTSHVVKILIRDGLINNRSVVCSPTLIDAVLRILAVGAKNSTLEGELLRALGHANVEELNAAAREFAGILKDSYDDDEDDEDDDYEYEEDEEDYEPVISYVNALLLDQRFSLDNLFHKVLRDVHNAEARAVDFRKQADEVVNEENSWAEEQTNGLIKQFLTRNHIRDDTVSLLANALHFKGIYLSKFYQECTKNDEFHLLNGDKIQVPFMNQGDKHYAYGTFEECQVLRIPYESFDCTVKRFSMYIFLPNEINGLPNLMENIKIDRNLFKDDGRFKLDWAIIKRISIPIFNLESDFSLKTSMKQLGLTLPFEATCNDFSGTIGGSDPLYVNDVVQKCRVENNEQVSKVATNSTCSCRCEASYVGLGSPTIVFLANRPFMFMIREDVSGALLFIGSVLDPK